MIVLLVVWGVVATATAAYFYFETRVLHEAGVQAVMQEHDALLREMCPACRRRAIDRIVRLTQNKKSKVT